MSRAILPGRGKVIQLAFVPKDFDAALRFWIERMGIGPFYLLEHLPYQNVIYRGQPITVDATVALAYWDDLQIEIIKQHNDEVLSGYTESTEVRAEGLHHVLVASDDIDALHKSWLDCGATELMTGSVPGAGRFIYLDVGDGGPHVELAYLEPNFRKLFDFMHREAASWDGADPIRQVPDESEWSAAEAR
jgi:methylmalonyl-CoA/ethylmalonyl-CoA epimerase